MGDKAREYVEQKIIDSFYEKVANDIANNIQDKGCLLYTSPSPRDPM